MDINCCTIGANMIDFKLFTKDGLEILQCEEVLMLDWDLSTNPKEQKNKNYMYQTVTIKKRDDVFDIIDKNKRFLPKYLRDDFGIRLYWTPNGVRGFLTSHLIKAGSQSCNLIMQTLTIDNAYKVITSREGVYNVRISKKLDRKNDYIACFWTSVGKKDITSEIIPYIKTHDELCKINRSVVEIPEELTSNNVLKQLIRSKEEEPWEPVHEGVLNDWLEEMVNL